MLFRTMKVILLLSKNSILCYHYDFLQCVESVQIRSFCIVSCIVDVELLLTLNNLILSALLSTKLYVPSPL